MIWYRGVDPLSIGIALDFYIHLAGLLAKSNLLFNFNLMCLWHVSLLEVELVFTYDPGTGDVTSVSVPG